QCTAEVVRVMSPKVFWPAPKVDSAIVRLVVDPERRAAIPDRQYFKDFTRALFLHKRKFLRANAVAALKHHLDKPQVDALLEAMQFSPEARTEQINIPTLLRFAELARAAAPDWKL
ncbi:MAG: rRNA adenine N-6-methyltransferase family protein, partial [Planctomycetota bacterium]